MTQLVGDYDRGKVEKTFILNIKLFKFSFREEIVQQACHTF